MNTPLAVVLLHFFGGSRREWDQVAPLLASSRHVVALDLSGFGDASDRAEADVAQMADDVDESIRDARFADCLIVGHSMSAKVAMVLAARAPDYLGGLVLVTASPPSPEPMSNDAREKLLAFDGSRVAAESYIDGITAERLPDGARTIAVEDAMRASPLAWRRWITQGSQEDCASVVGVLDLPTHVVAGAGDPSLGIGLQREFVLPHLSRASLATLPGGHLLPLENSAGLYREIETFAARLDESRAQSPTRSRRTWN